MAATDTFKPMELNTPKLQKCFSRYRVRTIFRNSSKEWFYSIQYKYHFLYFLPWWLYLSKDDHNKLVFSKKDAKLFSLRHVQSKIKQLIQNELNDFEREKEKIIDARTILTYENEDDNDEAVPGNEQPYEEAVPEPYEEEYNFEDLDDEDLNDEDLYGDLQLGRGPECRNL